MIKITVSTETIISGETTYRDYILHLCCEETKEEDLTDWLDELSEFLDALEEDECNDANGPVTPRVLDEVQRMLTGLGHGWKMPQASIFHSLPGYNNEMTVWVKGERNDR